MSIPALVATCRKSSLCFAAGSKTTGRVDLESQTSLRRSTRGGSRIRSFRRRTCSLKLFELKGSDAMRDATSYIGHLPLSSHLICSGARLWQVNGPTLRIAQQYFAENYPGISVPKLTVRGVYEELARFKASSTCCWEVFAKVGEAIVGLHATSPTDAGSLADGHVGVVSCCSCLTLNLAAVCS